MRAGGAAEGRLSPAAARRAGGSSGGGDALKAAGAADRHRKGQGCATAAQAAAAAAAAAGSTAALGPEAGSLQPPVQPRLDRQSLAVSLLVDGRPHAFVDFFELTAGRGGGEAGRGLISGSGGAGGVADAAGAAAASAAAAAGQQGAGSGPSSSGGGGGGDQPQSLLHPDALLLLHEQLARADAAQKGGDARAAFAAFRQLGRFFAARHQLPEAAEFYGRCRRAAADARWADGELEASCALGLVYERLGAPDAAVACHQRCLELALSTADVGESADARAEEARRTLVHIYAQQAEQREKAGNLPGAASFLEKCLALALACSDLDAAGAAHHHLGLLCAAQERWQEASEHQAAYVRCSKEAGNAAAESAATRAYADCLRRLGDTAGAIQSLQAYLALQEAAHDTDAHGPALVCCQLGCLHHQRGALGEAVASFERAFELARGLPDPRLLSAARANLGAARAALRARDYMAAALGDLQRLLEMKGPERGC